MSIPRAATLCTAVILLLNGQRASALTVESQLTPGHLQGQDFSLTIETKNADGLQGFTVTIQPAVGKRLSPFFYSELSLYTANEAISKSAVQPIRDGGKVTYGFQVSPRLLANSRFEFDEGLYQLKRDEKAAPVRDEDGNTVYEPLIGGFSYWFKLQDFANQSAKP